MFGKLMVFGVVLVACAPSTQVRARPARTLELASGGAATIVIGNFADWRAVNLLDDDGRVVGQLSGRSLVTVKRAPGPFKLYAVPERDGARGDRIEGTVEAGQIYYVGIGLRYGGVSMTRSEPFDDSLGPVTLDPAGAVAITAELGVTHALIAEIDGAVNRFDQDRRLARHIDADRGYPCPGVALASARR